MTTIKPFFNVGKSAGRDTKNNCMTCGLYSGCITPRMPLTGKGKKGIFVLAEAPGEQEDKRGIQLIGASGQRLREELDRHGIDLDRDCWKMNAVNCRPANNKTPNDKQINCCRSRVMEEIKAKQPRVILALGGISMKSLYGHKTKHIPGINNWIGEVIPDGDLGAYVVPAWHPAFVLRAENFKNGVLFVRRWRKALKSVIRFTKKEKPKPNHFLDHIELFPQGYEKEAVKYLEHLHEWLILSGSPLAWDWEATGLKPYTEGHRLVSCGLAWKGKDDQYLGAGIWYNETTAHPIEQILTDERIPKVGHNSAFDRMWAIVRGCNGIAFDGYEVKNIIWDTLLGERILDNRVGRSGLKFLSHAKFGVPGYDDEISPFLETKHANGINKILSAPERPLLLYNGADAVFTLALYDYQMPLIRKDSGLSEAFDLYFEGSLALSDVEINGMCVDLEYVRKQQRRLDKKIDKIHNDLLLTKEVKIWKKKFGKSFNLNSPDQLKWLLHDKLKLPILKQTEKSTEDDVKASVDKEALDMINTKHRLPFLEKILEIRKIEKISGTYLKSFVDEAPDGFLHPFFKLSNVRSYRTSCDSPNFQNIPKHDAFAKEVCRKAIKPPQGFCWIDVDYSSIEVRVSACIHKDPTMIKYLKDRSTDMHRDMAMDLFMLPQAMISKSLRQTAKNKFVFAQFYGDYWKSCARYIWEFAIDHKSPQGLMVDGDHVSRHLRKQGIKTIEDYEDHVRDVEEKMWNVRFPVYNQWRIDRWEDYLRTGEFRSPIGFKFGSQIMDKNDAINWDCQGTAAHCLIWSLTRVNERIKREALKSNIMGQIHDALNLAGWPPELNYLLIMLRKTMIDRLMQRFKWINVPMDVEIEMAPINGSWYDINEIHFRPRPCDCGFEWGYKNGDGWECPLCGVKHGGY